ncbi:MAG: AMP-binding protein [Gammaproteobacteria bacterium]|nr:AMP-binding protein [Gammaproteobacteria bacterium]
MASRNASDAWSRHYAPATPHTIDATRFTSIPALIADSVQRHPTRTALLCLGATLTYAEFDTLSARFAAWLQRECSVRAGDRVAIMLPNLLQFPVALLGAMRAGATVVNINPLYTAHELTALLEDAECSVIVVMENFADKVAALPARLRPQVIVTGPGDLHDAVRRVLLNGANHWLRGGRRAVRQLQAPGHRFRTCITRYTADDLDEVAPVASDIALLQYTGGTTGTPKGVMLSHGNIVANTLQCGAWFAGFVQDEGEVMLTPLPLYHIYALTASLLVFLRLGGTCHLVPDPRDIAHVVHAMQNPPCTAMTGVNTLFRNLLQHPAFTSASFDALKLTSAGGMAIAADVARAWQDATGCLILEGYGLTEASPVVTCNPVTLHEFNGSIGLPLPSTTCSIRDGDGEELPDGAPGELWVQGPQVMQGYWRRPELTAATLDAQGWLHTGDIATRDTEGFLRIVDRKKDMIIVSGFNVYPAEVEQALAAIEGVLEVAVIGVPDDERGESIVAFVVRADSALTADQLIAAAKQRLASYKRPQEIVFVESLPKSQIGKIVKRDLRSRLNRENV